MRGPEETESVPEPNAVIEGSEAVPPGKCPVCGRDLCTG